MVYMLKDILTDQLQMNAYLYGKDLAASSDEVMSSCIQGCARNPLSFTTEAAGFNMLCSKLIRGETVSDMQGEYAKHSEYDTKEKAAAFLQESVDTLVKTIAEVSDEDLHKEVTAPWGQTMPAYKMAFMASWHMGYHDGQLNYVQALHGDDAVHWM